MDSSKISRSLHDIDDIMQHFYVIHKNTGLKYKQDMIVSIAIISVRFDQKIRCILNFTTSLRLAETRKQDIKYPYICILGNNNIGAASS